MVRLDDIIKETQRLFSIEGIENGQVQVKVSNYLLSLPDEKQIEVLTRHLENLKENFAKYEDSGFGDPTAKHDEVKNTQVRLLMQVIESLLSNI